MKNKLRNYLLPGAIAALLMLPGGGALKAQEKLRPFILAWQGAAKVETKVAEMKSKLAGNGFEILGVHSPYAGATIISFTSAALKRNAAQSASGGYGAAQRLAVTAVGGQVQVSYTNPAYMANAYRMAGDLTGVAAKLQTILGKKSDFGSEKGLAAEKLRKYHYMFGMEYFDDPSELAEFDSFSQALKAVERGLAAGRGGVTKVYRVDLPGKNETVFGVALSTGCSGDDYIMGRIDFKELRATAHLPYEILVSGKKVFALFARFRIAVNFPDLSMVGDHSFFSIMCAPGEIEDALEKVVAN